MDTEILTLGDELCRGEIVDTNSSFLAERLTDLGFRVRWMSSATDDLSDIEAAFTLAAGRAALVVVSGGLGPTEDDRTVDAAGRVFGREIVTDERALAAMDARFQKIGFTRTPNNLRQVRVLAGSEVLENRWGLAPGFVVSHRGATFAFMPGVPREMRPMFEEEAVPRLVALSRARVDTAGVVASAVRHLRVFGLGESHIDHKLAGLSKGEAVGGPEGITVHYRVSYPECFVKIIVRRVGTGGAADEAAEALAAEARRRLGPYVYADEKTTLPAALGAALRTAGLSFATAESCTGGLIGSLVTDVPGSSEYFLAGYIAYANEAKKTLLGVREETLASHGAVSPECVAEMALGATRLSGAKLAVAVSGIAGPDGATADKPVGTVHLALTAPDLSVPRTLARRFAGAREQVKLIAAYTAIEMARRHVLGLEPLP